MINGTLLMFDSLNNFWHSHVYAKPPKNPTPHLISNILGLDQNDSEQQSGSLSSSFHLSLSKQKLVKVSKLF